MRSEIQSSVLKKPSFIEASRRAQIIDCAAEAIAELGFAQASLAQIARRAGVSTGVILYYFAGKDVLIRELVAHVFALGSAFVQPRVLQTSARVALRSFIEANAGFVASNPRHVLAVMNIMRAGRSETGAPRFDPVVTQPRRDGLLAILRAGHDTGEFRPFDLRVMAVTIIEALDAIPPELLAEPALDFAAYGRELAELFDRATRRDAADQPTQ